MKHTWKWNDSDLHYLSFADYCRRNIGQYFVAVMLGLFSVGLIVFYSIWFSWWLLYWIAMLAANVFTAWFWPHRTYYKVILRHMEYDRQFISDLESDGIPTPVAQDMLNTLEQRHLPPAQAIYEMGKIYQAWEDRDR